MDDDTVNDPDQAVSADGSSNVSPGGSPPQSAEKKRRLTKEEKMKLLFPPAREPELRVIKRDGNWTYYAPYHSPPDTDKDKDKNTNKSTGTMSVQLPPVTYRQRTVPQSELEASSTLKLGADQHTHTLSLSEARLVIRKVLENKQRGENRYEPPETLSKTLDYLDVFARFKDEENIKAVERLLNSHTELEMFERSQLGSLCCDNAEEAKSLIPSLQNKISDGDLQELLDELTKLRNFTE
ncbi:polymerase (RNA) II (DNA directed) polypeptide D [Penicillium argentinense]|uniref:Polymerase (RNA) II (DNA directed) polypeptide D n=1 Tax=Penicillium argentinense TaxID=1131581 RepID=A0A9W9KMX0_9EURO|nr:polymerase (RNA) II (DNA directed) polypeptide D [Penicillium argentinense]KAJ5111421.1 polymerase (RNA) II (DNA directed) polypeptide D [Penicillium argentinense]